MTICRRLVIAALLAAGLMSAPMAAAGQPAGAPAPTAERPILVLDQVRSGLIPSKLMSAIQPLKTLEEVEALLKANDLAYRRGIALIDSRSAPAELVKLIAGLPPGEVFVLPDGGGATFNRVVRAVSPQEAARIAQPPPARPRTPAT